MASLPHLESSLPKSNGETPKDFLYPRIPQHGFVAHNHFNQESVKAMPPLYGK